MRLFILLTIAMPPLAAREFSYEREIAPILRSYCAGCHNDKDKEGELSLETYAQFRQGGEDHGDPIKPGDSPNSFFIKAIAGHEKPKMPPKDEPQVPSSDLKTLEKWVLAGAPGPLKDESILRTLTIPALPPAITAAPFTAGGFSPDGSRLALGKNGTIEVRDATTEAVILTISGLPGKVNALHFSPDGQQLIAASGISGLTGVARLHDSKTGALVREFSGHKDVLYDAEISPDGKMLATAGYDRIIHLWNMADGTLVRSIDVHKGAIFDLSWHPGSAVLAAASADETVKLWRVSDGVRLDTLNQAQGELSTVFFSGDGKRIYAAGRDRRIHAWHFVSKDSPALNPVEYSRFAHEAPITGMALSADGRHILTSAEDRSVKLWTVPELTLAHSFPAQPDMASVLLGTPKTDRFFVARMDGGTSAFDLPNAKPESAAGVVAFPPATSERPGEAKEFNETEPNQDLAAATPVTTPATIKGAVEAAGDVDLFRFAAGAGEVLTLEVNAARSGSKLDSRLEILTAEGRPVEQVVLQATRDSWFTFRGKDSDTSDDFRLHNWAEMELNEYLYANGEVVKLWLYPRGPDSGFKVYPGSGLRQTRFGTPALVHALGAPAFVVTPLPAGSDPAPNGLPVFRLNYENDDDSGRRTGADSLLLFTAPKDGDYLVRLTDVRRMGGPKDFTYTLHIRPQDPRFTVQHGDSLKVSPGSGRELSFKLDRFEGFEGPVRIEITNLPAGFTATTPLEIEAAQISAMGAIHARNDATTPSAQAVAAIKITAMAMIGDREVLQELPGLKSLELAATPKVTIEIIPGTDKSFVREIPGQPMEFVIHPGQTISAKVRAVRHDFKERIELGTDDCGRNLPHGVYVDNIGLNGLLIVEDRTEREFFLTAAKTARPGTRRLFHLRTTADGSQASAPVLLRVE